VDGDDIGVIELAGNLRFLHEPHGAFLGLVMEDDFHGDPPANRAVPGIENRAHSALGDDLPDFVFAGTRPVAGQESWQVASAALHGQAG